MLLGTPAHSPYDWNFVLFQFPIRVTWTFWVFGAAYGYEMCQNLDLLFAQNKLDTPGFVPLLVVWVMALFVSILVHEFGHALAFRYFGVPSEVVLYHMGGLAIPQGFGSWGGARQQRLGNREHLLISAAGPAAQISLGLVVLAVAIALGQTPGFFATDWINYFGIELPFPLSPPSNALAFGFFEFLIYPSIMWAILNLVPVLPLDGGSILQRVIGMYRGGDGWREATLVSVITGFGLGLWFFQTGHTFFGFLLVLLGISNLQTLQSMNGIGGGRW